MAVYFPRIIVEPVSATKVEFEAETLEGRIEEALRHPVVRAGGFMAWIGMSYESELKIQAAAVLRLIRRECTRMAEQTLSAAEFRSEMIVKFGEPNTGDWAKQVADEIKSSCDSEAEALAVARALANDWMRTHR